MISFKTNNKLKYFFIGNFYRIFYSNLGIFDLLFLVVYIYLEFHILSILFVLFIFILIPLIRFFIARIYHKSLETEYFFDSDYFGLKVAGGEIKFKKSDIRYIKIFSNCFVIKVLRQKLFFIGSDENIIDIREKLLNSSYKEFIKE